MIQNVWDEGHTIDRSKPKDDPMQGFRGQRTNDTQDEQYPNRY